MQQHEEGEESETEGGIVLKTGQSWSEATGQMRQADEKSCAPSYLTDLDDNRH